MYEFHTELYIRLKTKLSIPTDIWLENILDAINK